MRGTDDQTALAVPRVALPGAQVLALPQPLSPAEAARVRHIFALQAAGNVAEAVRETQHLDSDLLLGPILADRYLGGWSHPNAAELNDWLAKYGDQPDAPAIRALRARFEPEPTPAIGAFVRRHAATASSASIRSLFVQNRDADAVAAATPLLSRPPAQTGTADPLFAGGLAAWRLGDRTAALAFFTATYRAAPNAPLHAAGAYWAARTAQRQADRGAYLMWLRRAAEEADTFYGRIAGRSLGLSRVCLARQTLGTADLDMLAITAEGRRAFALLQVGEKRRAEAELRTLWTDAGEYGDLARPLALLARDVGMPSFAAELQAAQPAGPHGTAPPTLHPAGGFLIDPPLVYALVHHESGFRAAAVSRSGAQGLMQIKPATARTVSGDGVKATQLHDPAANLALGQRYLLQLSGDDAIDGDIIRLLAGYAEGLFGMKRWADGVQSHGDPLLFLEAVPNPATRSFVQDILAWSWHYAAAMNLPSDSLTALASGQDPLLETAGAAAAALPRCPSLAP